MFWKRTPGITRGEPNCITPTPYQYTETYPVGLGDGVLGFALKRPFAPPLDYILGRGVGILGSKMTTQPAFYQGAQAKRISDPVAIPAISVTPGPTQLWDPGNANVSAANPQF